MAEPAQRGNNVEEKNANQSVNGSLVFVYTLHGSENKDFQRTLRMCKRVI